jgi:acyl transferase domain-containing protein
LTTLQKAYLLLDEMQAKVEALEADRTERIAIVGMGCRFPGGVEGPEDYWRLLWEGRHGVEEIPAERWDVAAHYDPDPAAPGKMITRWGGYLRDVDLFDPQFFGITPREAQKMDPQQRLLLEVSWEALEDAGIPPDGLVGSATGVFWGVPFSEYASLLLQQGLAEMDGYFGSGNQLCFTAGRISYTLGLRGPSVPVDTACSSSLVAIHQACRSLRAGECDLALAGGVNLVLIPDGNVFLSKAGALSPTGVCRAFDAGADGMVRSEGCGVVVLKRLRDAVADGDAVVACIRGSAVNHDGRSSGLTVPNGAAQEQVIRRALRHARIEPDQVSYIEAHGTGTPLGDPIELQALAAVFGRRPPGADPLQVGSVKTNLGHTEAASGIASVLKVALMLRHREIPPHLHFQELNPRATLGGAAIRIPTRRAPWREGSGPRIAGVSAFGLSGTNAHVVLEEAPAPAAPVPDPREEHLLPISARRPEALQALVAGYRDLLAVEAAPAGGAMELSVLCRCAATGRSHQEHRLVVRGRTTAEVHDRLAAHLGGEAVAQISQGRRPLPGPPRIAFVFSGQGPQRPGMGLELAAAHGVFRATLEECDALVRQHGGFSLMAELAARGERCRLHETEVAQPALFAIQVGLAALWRSWGVEPDGVVGHSLGEVAAACVAGALLLEEAVPLVCHRARLLQRVTGAGRMVAIGLAPDAAARAIEGYAGRLAVAAINGPSSAVLSGEVAALDEVVARLREQKVFCCPLPVDYAFHSPQTEPLGRELATLLGTLEPRVPRLPLVSTVSGQLVGAPGLDADHWGQNVARPVQFAAAVERLVESECRVFLELGPQPALATPLRQCLESRGVEGQVVSSLSRDEAEPAAVLAALADLYAGGVTVNWKAIYPGGGPRTPLPRYPWQRRRFWADGAVAAGRPGQAAVAAAGRPRHPLLGYRLESPAHRPEDRFWERELGDGGHGLPGLQRVHRQIHVPCTTLAQLALAAAQEALDGGQPVVVTDLRLASPLVVAADRLRILQLGLTAQGRREWLFQVYSRPATGDEGGWTLHATAKLEGR